MKKQFVECLIAKQYEKCTQILSLNSFLLKEEDMNVYIFSYYCYILDFEKVKKMFIEIKNKDSKYEYILLENMPKIVKDLSYCEPVLQLYFDLLKISKKQIGIMEIGDGLIDSKKYKKARDFFIKVLDIDKDDFTALKHSVQLSNFICDFDTTKEIITQDILDNYKNDEFKYNILLNELEIAEHKVYLKSKPRTMLVAVTTKCNIKCLMCTRDKIWDISESMKNEIISMFKYLEIVVWQGGEVFLYKYFFELLKLSKINENIRHIIVTNGLFFSDKWINLLLSIKNLDLTVSIDGTTKEIYEKIRVGARFEQLIDNLTRFANKKKMVTSNIVLTLRCAVMKSNYKQIVDFIKFAIKYSFNIVIFAPVQNLYTEENIWNNLTEDMNDYIYEQYTIAEKLAKKNNISLINWLPIHKRKIENLQNSDKNILEKEQKFKEEDNKYCQIFEEDKIICFRPWKQIVLNVDGFVTPECLCQKQITTIDRIVSFSDAWNSVIMQEYRKKLTEQNYEWCNRDCISGAIAKEHLKFISR